MGATVIEIDECKVVEANSVFEDTQIIEDGKKVCIYDFKAGACFCNDVKVEVTFGDEVVRCCHGEVNERLRKEYTASGDTNLKLRLVNDTSQQETLKGYYWAKKW